MKEGKFQGKRPGGNVLHPGDLTVRVRADVPPTERPRSISTRHYRQARRSTTAADRTRIDRLWYEWHVSSLLGWTGNSVWSQRSGTGRSSPPWFSFGQFKRRLKTCLFGLTDRGTSWFVTNLCGRIIMLACNKRYLFQNNSFPWTQKAIVLKALQSINQSIDRSIIYLSRNAVDTGPDTKGGCNIR